MLGNMSKLDPCPICGDAASPAVIRDYDLGHMVTCGSCDASIADLDEVAYLPLVFTEGQPHALHHSRPEPVDGCNCAELLTAQLPCPVCAALIAAHPEYSQPC